MHTRATPITLAVLVLTVVVSLSALPYLPNPASRPATVLAASCPAAWSCTDSGNPSAPETVSQSGALWTVQDTFASRHRITPTATSSPTGVPTTTPTHTATLPPSATATASATPTSTATATSSDTATATASATSTPGPSSTPASTPTSLLPPFITSVDTMKESRDTETRPLTDAQIADDVNLAATMNTNYITVDTHWDYPDYMQRWVNAVRATGRHVWFRIHPNQWGNNNGTTGIMTPSAYEASEQAFILAHPALFLPGDILDPCPEPENGLYWKATYGSGWTANAPNVATRDYNSFIRTTTDVADAALHTIGIYGVITTVRSTNSFFATHPADLEAATVAKLGHVTIDSYPEGSTTDPNTAANARLTELNSVAQTWPGVPIIIGEMGYSNKVLVDDATQASVLQAEFNAIAPLSFVAGINYWVGAGTNNSGGYTHVYAGSTGNWTLRPAGFDLASFFNEELVSHPR